MDHAASFQPALKSSAMCSVQTSTVSPTEETGHLLGSDVCSRSEVCGERNWLEPDFIFDDNRIHSKHFFTLESFVSFVCNSLTVTYLHAKRIPSGLNVLGIKTGKHSFLLQKWQIQRQK